MGDTQCAYTHDTSGERFEDIPGERWSCPHEAPDGRGRCPLHDPASTRQQIRSTIRDACQQALDRPRQMQFLGAECDLLDLGHLATSGDGTFPIDLRDATLDTVTFERASVRHPVLLDGADIGGSLVCERTVFEREFSISGAVVRGETNFEFAEFRSWFDVADTRFHGEVSYNGALLRRGINAQGATFQDRSTFSNTNFDELANFREATFVGYANFSGPEFHLDARFDGSTFGTAFFETARFHQVGMFRSVTFEGPVSFRNCIVRGRASFQNATFTDSALFPGAEFGSIATFRAATFDHGVDLQAVSVSEIEFTPAAIRPPEDVVEFTESTIGRGVVRVPPVGASLIRFSEATLGDVELRSDRTELTLDSFLLYDVEYDGFQFSNLANEFRNEGGRLELTNTANSGGVLSLLGRSAAVSTASAPADPLQTPSTQLLEQSYRRAKNGADSVGQPKMASYFFRKEMIHRRKGHWQTVHDASARSSARVTAGFRWLANAVLYVTAGYGERPSWAIVNSVVSIVVFGLVYTAAGVYQDDSAILDSFLFSIQSFVTFVLGNEPDTTNTVVEFLTAAQGFVGAFLIAVFVFTLTRTVYR